MDIYLSKLIPLFVYPLGFSIILLIGAMTIQTKRPGVARVLLGFLIGFLWIASMPFVSYHLCSSLEWRYPPMPVAQTPAADAIVVLGGTARVPEPPRLSVELVEASDRLLHAARLYRAGKAPFILVSGGYIQWLGVAAPEATAMRALLMEWGVPDKAIIMESASQNTRENATFTKQLMARHRLEQILLVTSASHMPRAFATFSSAGISAIPAPTDFTVNYKDRFSLLDFLPSAGSLSATTDMIKEYVGYAYYWLMGWIGIQGPANARQPG